MAKYFVDISVRLHFWTEFDSHLNFFACFLLFEIKERLCLNCSIKFYFCGKLKEDELYVLDP
jgi:hypothetical protein